MSPTLESPTAACPPFPSLSIPAPASPTTDDAAAARLKQSKVMIVDDEAMNIKILRRLLELEGFTSFVTTSDAPTAISLDSSGAAGHRALGPDDAVRERARHPGGSPLATKPSASYRS